MQNLSVKRMLALSVVGRAIREIEADPKRGLRRMMDLGREMSHSGARQSVFAAMQDLLQKPDSPCYALLSRAVREVDRQTLKKFCVALGWDCWTEGDQALRAGGEQLPWAMRLTLDGTDDLRGLRTRWKDLRRKGVRMLVADIQNQAGLQQALVLTLGVTDGAFLFYMPPALVTPATVPAMAACNTLAVAVEETENALTRLRQNGCLYGVFRRCAPAETAHDAHGWLERLCDRHGYFAVLHEQRCACAGDVVQMLRRGRMEQRFALIPLAAQADFQMIQQTIFA